MLSYTTYKIDSRCIVDLRMKKKNQDSRKEEVGDYLHEVVSQILQEDIKNAN